jgi:hypothetical protein
VKRSHLARLAALSFVVLGGLGDLGPAAHAEVSIAIGDVEDATREASAKFNEGLSSFHLMLAALDRKDMETANKYQMEATEQIGAAASAYNAAASKADEHELEVKPRSEQEAADVAYFQARAPKFDIKLPVSQHALLAATSRLVGAFGTDLKAAKLAVLTRSDRAEQALLVRALTLQAFLNSATTMLLLG